jgi:hypothetical protein
MCPKTNQKIVNTFSNIGEFMKKILVDISKHFTGINLYATHLERRSKKSIK